MCKRISTIIICAILLPLVFSSVVYSQDTLVNKQGVSTAVRIIRILPETIEYKKYINPEGPLYVIKKCDNREIRFQNGTIESLAEECTAVTAKEITFKRLATSVEFPLGMFGLFNVDDKFTKAKYTFGATPSVVYRYNNNFATGLECMLLWGQVDTTDPIRFIINPNIRNEILFPLKEKLTLVLITSAGLSIWPQDDTVGTLDTTYFNNRTGWNARAAFGIDWLVTPSLSLLCNAGYSASSSVSDNVWITHDMMMITIGIRYLFDVNRKGGSAPQKAGITN